MLGVLIALLLIIAIFSAYCATVWLVFARSSPARDIARNARIVAIARRESLYLDDELEELLSA